MKKLINIRNFSLNTYEEILPYSSVKRISLNGEVINAVKEKREIDFKTKPKSPQKPLLSTNKNVRFNEVNIQMISQMLYDQLFSDSAKCEISEKVISK